MINIVAALALFAVPLGLIYLWTKKVEREFQEEWEREEREFSERVVRGFEKLSAELDEEIIRLKNNTNG